MRVLGITEDKKIERCPPFIVVCRSRERGRVLYFRQGAEAGTHQTDGFDRGGMMITQAFGQTKTIVRCIRHSVFCSCVSYRHIYMRACAMSRETWDLVSIGIFHSVRAKREYMPLPGLARQLFIIDIAVNLNVRRSNENHDASRMRFVATTATLATCGPQSTASARERNFEAKSTHRLLLITAASPPSLHRWDRLPIPAREKNPSKR